MYNKIHRDSEYMSGIKNFLCEKYNINAISISIIPAKRGYYGETWRVETTGNIYFVKLDYFPRHQKIFQNSLPVVEYLCNSGIDFINNVVKTHDGRLYSHFNSAVLAVFDWIDGENIETNCTKTPEYQMLCKVYPLTKQGFDIPTMEFSSHVATRVYSQWEGLKSAPQNRAYDAVNAMLEAQSKQLSHCALRLSYFAALCQKDKSHFYFTHGDAGGNFFVSKGRNYIVDWDEVMYAPLERDAWVMCCRDWAVQLFNDTLMENKIEYQLRPERLAFYCYHMFFHYLGEFLEDLVLHDNSKRIAEYFSAGWIDRSIRFADGI